MPRAGTDLAPLLFFDPSTLYSLKYLKSFSLLQAGFPNAPRLRGKLNSLMNLPAHSTFQVLSRDKSHRRYLNIERTLEDNEPCIA